MEEDRQEQGFVIKDRRHFDETGDPRSGASEQTDPPGGQEAAAASPSGRGSEGPTAGQAEAGPLPEVTFANFIFSLSTTAMYHFGDIADPATGESCKNLPAAKQTIDILSLLRAKTQGNLSEEEKELLDGALYELRMRFVKEVKKP
jgi:hypothetical protein